MGIWWQPEELSSCRLRTLLHEVIMFRILTGVFLAVGALSLAGCEFEDWGNSDRFKEDFSYNYPLKPGGKLYLETFNGSVEVLGWDKDSIDITGTKYAATEDLLKQLKVDIATDPDSVRIRTIRPSDRRGSCGAKYVVRLPKKAVIDRVETSNGSLRVESIEGPARLRTSNASIRAWGLKGDLDATTSNGTIEVEQFDGSAVLRTSNARIKADGVKGVFEGSTSNGAIDVSLGEMDAAKPIKLHSSNGSISLVMDSYKNNEVRAETSNSSINVRLPSALSAQVRASTSNGTITSDFETKTTTFSKTKLDGTVGSGGALVELTTSNGNIRLMRK
jgi:hypothetical protein